jgi:PAS domain S-box-containing protein
VERSTRPAEKNAPPNTHALELEQLMQELQVHQIELEMQNEELRAAQLESDAARREYLELFESAPTGYVLVDHRQTITRANLAACKLLGLTGMRLIGRTMRDFLADAESAIKLASDLQAARCGCGVDCELRLKRADRSECFVRLNICGMPSQSSACLVVLTDISERQRAQLALEHSNRQLDARSAQLEAQNQQLQAEIRSREASEAQRRELELRLLRAERLQSLGMLAAGIAHDFNNLLMGLLGNAELMLRMPQLPECLREPLSVIQRTGRDASELTRQLLMFAGKGRVEMTRVDLSMLISDCVGLVRGRVDHDVEIRCELPQALSPIAADRAHVQRVLINLLTNAVEAVDQSGVIELSVATAELDARALAEYPYAHGARPGRFAIVHIADNGRGIDAATLTHIFDPFFSTKFTGRGLGLATVLGIVQSHCGAIRVSSTPGRGTSFDVALPLAQVAPALERASRDDGVEWRGTGRVLVIDDDDDVRRVVEKMLNLLGFEVVAANGGETGLAAFVGSPKRFDLVVLDWLMPGMSGERVLTELRKLASELPVIWISGYSAERLPSDLPHVLRLQKPMTLDQLRDAVRSVSPGAAGHTSILHV